MFKLFKENRYFLRFFLSRFVSRIGDGVHSLALLWIAYKWGKSGIIIAAVMVAFSLPGVLVSPLAGQIADRMRRARIMAATDIVQAVCVFALSFLAFSHALNLWNLIAITVVMSVAQGFFMPASLSIVPQIVKQEEITKANALVQIGSSFSILIGPLVGVSLIALIGLPLAFAANGVSFLLSALLLYGIKTVALSVQAQVTSFIASIKDGLKLIKQHPIVSRLIGKAAIINLFYGSVTIIIPLFAGNIYHMGAKGIGFMMGAFAAGIFVSSIVMGSVRITTSDRIVVSFSTLLMGVMFIVFGTLCNFYISLLSLFLIGAGVNISNVSIISVYQKRLPDQVLGRIMSFLGAIALSLLPVSYALTGVLVSLIGTRSILIVSGIIIIFMSFQMLKIKELN